MKPTRVLSLLTLAALATATAPLRADEGIWLFNEIPRKRMEARYGFQVTNPFLDHLRLASARFSNGGSGSFVSPNGLLFTNHHVGSECIHELSTAEHDYMADGFFAKTPEEERGCPNLEVNILLRIEDVTSQVKGAVKEGMDLAAANKARKAQMSALEKACTDRTGNRCDVVTLYAGGIYNLYEYKKYTDIRLVFAPEASIAAFGGDPDNFTYPRYCLDFALFRAYENGKPVPSKDFLKWSHKPIRDGELIFVSGNPGTTGRMATMAELKFYRDTSYPIVLERLASMIDQLKAFGAKSEEDKRVAEDDLASLQNSFKAYTGFLAGLRDPELTDTKATEQGKLQKFVEATSSATPEEKGTWKEISAAYQEYAQFYKPYWLLERSPAYGSDLFPIARDLIRLAEETKKPDSERLREFTESNLPSIKQELFSTAPISKPLETMELAEYLRNLVHYLGADDPTVRKVLEGRTPEEAAAYYVGGTHLDDVDVRKKLAASGEALAQSNDTMLQLVRRIEPRARELRKRYEDKVEAQLVSAATRIAKIRFQMSGTDDYPDATFTLRLSYGTVEGYTNEKGEKVPFETTFAGLYERATGVEPFKLPQRWIDAKSRIDLSTPFNFVSTADTHGGNSGSPTVNRQNEIVGILFDGNLESLPNRFVYTDKQARSVHVASQGIVEALRKVYHAGRILKELGFEQ